MASWKHTKLYQNLVGRYFGMRREVAISQSIAVMIYATISIVFVGIPFILGNLFDIDFGIWNTPEFGSALLMATPALILLAILRRNAWKNWRWIELVNYVTVIMVPFWFHLVMHSKAPETESMTDLLMCFGVVVLSTMLYMLPVVTIPVLVVVEALYLYHICTLSPNVGFIRPTTSMGFTIVCAFLTVFKHREGYRLYMAKAEAERAHQEAQEMAEIQAMYASYDQLTGLKNRRAFSEESQRIAEDDTVPFCLIMADINGLKEANDSMGHKAGDELLIGASDCLREAFEGIDFIYRIGGDEFCVILKDNPEQAEQLLHHLDSLAAEWTGQYIHGLSIAYGVASSSGHADLDSIIKEADRKMYENKREYYTNRYLMQSIRQS